MKENGEERSIDSHNMSISPHSCVCVCVLCVQPPSGDPQDLDCGHANSTTGLDGLASRPDPCVPNGLQKTKASQTKEKQIAVSLFMPKVTQELPVGMCIVWAP